MTNGPIFLVYGIGAFMSAFIGWLMFSMPTAGTNDKRNGARAMLLSPLWPVALLALVVYGAGKGLAILWRTGFGGTK